MNTCAVTMPFPDKIFNTTKKIFKDILFSASSSSDPKKKYMKQ